MKNWRLNNENLAKFWKSSAGRTIVFTTITLALLSTLLYLQNLCNFKENIDVKIILLSFLPFIIYLIFTGRITGFKGGGIEVKLQQESRTSVSFAEEDVAKGDEEVLIKQNKTRLVSEVIPQAIEKPKSTLSLNLQFANEYKLDVLIMYLRELARFDFFKYVLFVEGNTFKGYVDARSLLFQLVDESKGESVVSHIRKGNLDHIMGFRTNCLKNYMSNRSALKKMEEENLSEMAIVDKEMRFLGFTDRNVIAALILKRLIIGDE